MPRPRLSVRAILSAAIWVGMTSLAAAQDPFDVPEQTPSSPSTKAATTAPTNPTTTTTPAAEKAAEKKAAAKPEPEFVRKSLQEWQRMLPRGVFEVTRLKATEPPFSGRYAAGHFEGTFVCACCDAELFSSRTKFDSGTGWPSFWQPVGARAIDRAIDNSDAEPRIEVTCHRCGAHLGHVFDDAIATPTGLRFCINSLSLKLKTAEEAPTRPASTRSKAKSTRTRSKAAARTTTAKGTPKPEAGAPAPGDGTDSDPKPPATGRPAQSSP